MDTAAVTLQMEGALFSKSRESEKTSASNRSSKKKRLGSVASASTMADVSDMNKYDMGYLRTYTSFMERNNSVKPVAATDMFNKVHETLFGFT